MSKFNIPEVWQSQPVPQTPTEVINSFHPTYYLSHDIMGPEWRGNDNDLKDFAETLRLTARDHSLEMNTSVVAGLAVNDWAPPNAIWAAAADRFNKQTGGTPPPENAGDPPAESEEQSF